MSDSDLTSNSASTSDSALKSELAPHLECDLLVLGASFTGIEVMHQLRRRGVLERVDTVVVDARAVHGYIPLVHEVVAGDVDPAAYVLPTAEYVRSLPRCSYIVDTVIRVDPNKREAELASGRLLRARVMIMALGSKVELPTRLGPSASIPSAKFLEQCQAIRERLHACVPGRLAVIGGGITGVEMAGELAMWCKHRGNGFSVTLIEARDHLLSMSGRGASRRAYTLLQRLGVEVMLDVQVTSIEERRITIVPQATRGSKAGVTSELDCALVVWAGGIRPAAVLQSLGVYQGPDGFIEVDPALRCSDARGEVLSCVFAGGDAVRVVDATGRWPTMQRAIECIWQGKVLARNVEAVLTAGPPDGSTSSRLPKLLHHSLVHDFPYGISIGSHSLVMYGRLVVNLRWFGVVFRRWLMRRYLARYRPLKQ